MIIQKATLEQWAEAGAFASATRACILELRARVMALEAQASNLKGSLTSSTPPPVATDEELKQTWLQGATLTQGHRAVYNLGIEHGQAGSREVADPAPVAEEMAELMADLRIMATWALSANQFSDGETLTRAANMIQQLSEQEAGR